MVVRIAMGCQIGALPCTPFASSRRSPQGETRSMERKNRESYISCTIPQFPPLVVNAVSQSAECLSCHMTQKANPVTLTSYSSPERAIPQPSARKAVKLKNPPAVRPVHLKNPFPQPFSSTLLHNPPPSGGHNPRGEAPSTLTPKVCPRAVNPIKKGPLCGPFSGIIEKREGKV